LSSLKATTLVYPNTRLRRASWAVQKAQQSSDIVSKNQPLPADLSPGAACVADQCCRSLEQHPCGELFCSSCRFSLL